LGRLAIRFVRGLRRLFGPPYPPPELFTSHYGPLDGWENPLTRQHWAADAWLNAPDRLPLRMASVQVREVAGRIKGVLFWSPAEDGGVYLYRFGEDRPFMRIAAPDLGAAGRHTDRGGAHGENGSGSATARPWSSDSNTRASA
jgi:hypothetical protein